MLQKSSGSSYLSMMTGSDGVSFLFPQTLLITASAET